MFGHDLGRSFATAANCITRRNAATLRPKWYFPIHSPVTAQAVVSRGVAYVGGSNGKFFAVRVANGKALWAKPFNAHRYDNNAVDYGAFPGSAAVETVAGRRVVIVGSGGTLFAIDAATGAHVAHICLDRVDPTCQGRAGFTYQIESSPAVIVAAGGARAQVLVGTDVNEASPAGPAGLVSVQFDGAQFTPQWFFDPEVGVTWDGLPPLMDKQHLTENGCNDVWSSPTVDVANGVVVFGLGNCAHPERVKRAAGVTKPTLVEGTVAVDLATGKFRWQATPRLPDNGLDLDFGATPNLLFPGVVGEAGKDGVYYAYESTTGKLLWKVKVAEASEIGGFIASTATGYLANGHRAVFLASAIPVSSNAPNESLRRIAGKPSRAFGVHAIDATTHTALWHTPLAPSYGAPIFSGRLVFVPNTFADAFVVLDAERGVPLRVQPLSAPTASPPVVTGDTVLIGTGIFAGNAGGLWAFTTTT